MNSLYALSTFLLAVLIDTVCVSALFGDTRNRNSARGIEIKRKAFRKSNHIAHFMGKRTENELGDILDIPNDLEGFPAQYQNEGMDFPGYVNDNQQPFGLEKFPFRRDNGELQVGHIFGRELPYDALGSLALQANNRGVSDTERSVLEALLGADPVQRETLVNLLLKDAMDKRRK